MLSYLIDFLVIFLIIISFGDLVISFRLELAGEFLSEHFFFWAVVLL